MRSLFGTLTPAVRPRTPARTLFSGSLGRIVVRGAVFITLFGGAQAQAVSGTLRYIGSPAMCWRSGAVMQQSNVVIGLIDVSGDGFEPPSTNGANKFCGPGDTASINPDTPPALGYTQLSWDISINQRGGVDGLIEGPDNNPLNALFRCFSAFAVTQAAYYADGGTTQLAPVPPYPQNDSGTWTNNTINPAYAMLGFDSFPIQYLDGATLCVSGSINTVAGGTDNLLDNAVVAVYWRSNETHAWQALLNPAITGNGNFTGVCTAVASHLMVGLTNGPDALPNSLAAMGPLDLSLLPIAAARDRGNGAAVTVGPASISATNNLAGEGYAFPVQDTETKISRAAGLMLADPDAARFASLIASNALDPNDRVILAGTNVFSNGVYCLANVTIVTNYGPATPVVSRPVSFDDLANGSTTAELYKSMLVTFSYAVFTTTGVFAAQAYSVTNKAGETATIRIASPSDPLIGTPIPEMPCVVTGIISQDDPTAPATSNDYFILPLSITLVPVASNVVQIAQAVAGTQTFCLVDFMTHSWSNGAPQIGYGTTPDGTNIDGSVWTWQNAVVTNASPFVAATTISFAAPGTYYYAARWFVDGTNYYGVNSTGQTNSCELGTAEYSIVITLPATSSNMVFMNQTVLTSAPSARIPFSTRSLSNGTAQIGYGVNQNGSGWTWINAAITNAASPFIAVTNFSVGSIGSMGTYYYGARWFNTIPGTNLYGWNTNGQINATAMAAQYTIVISTNRISVATVREHQVLLYQVPGLTNAVLVSWNADAVIGADGASYFDTNAWLFSCVPNLGTSGQVWNIEFVATNQYGSDTHTLLVIVASPAKGVGPKTPLVFEDEDGDLLTIKHSGVKKAGSIVLFDGQNINVTNALLDGTLGFTIKQNKTTGDGSFILRDVTMDNNGKSMSLAGNVNNVTMPLRTVSTLKFTSKLGVVSNVVLGTAKTISAKNMIVGTVAVSNGFTTLSAREISGAQIMSGVPADAVVSNTPATRGFKTLKATTMNNSVVAGRDMMNGSKVVVPAIKVKYPTNSFFYHTATNGVISKETIVP